MPKAEYSEHPAEIQRRKRLRLDFWLSDFALDTWPRGFRLC